jgi:hypothetical protein
MNEQQRRALDLARQAKEWPTISEIVEEYGIPNRTVRQAIHDGDIQAFRLMTYRVNPASVADWLLTRQNR